MSNLIRWPLPIPNLLPSVLAPPRSQAIRRAVAANVPITMTDSGVASETVDQAFSINDSGSGSDRAVVSATLTLAESGSAGETVSQAFSINDAGSQVETLTIAQTLSDGGNCSDLLVVDTGVVSKTLSDAGSAGDRVQKDLVNTFEGGTDGTQLTAGAGGNSGGASGNFFDAVSIPAGGTLAFETDNAPHGSLALATAVGVTAAGDYVQWGTSLGSQAVHAGRIYLRQPTALTGNDVIVRFVNTSTVIARLQLTTGRVLRVLDTASGVLATFTNLIPTDRPIRIEWVFTFPNSATGTAVVRLYLDDDGIVADEEQTVSSANFASLPLNIIRIGLTNGVASQPLLYFDDIGVRNTEEWMGPTGVSIVPITLTDAGAAADALTVTASVPLTDVGTGADALTSSAATTLTESSTGTDAITVSQAAAKTLTDAGVGADALALAAAQPLIESGIGVDAISVTATLTLVDSGSATDSMIIAAVRTILDGGTGADALTIAATATMLDGGVGVDSITTNQFAAKTLPDGGAAADALLIAVAQPLVDSGAGSDALTISTLARDSGTASERMVFPNSPYDTLVLSDNPVVFMANASGLDATGNGRNGALVNTPTVVKILNNDDAYLFNGIDEYVDLGDNNVFSPATTNRFTVEAWLRPDTLEFPDDEATQYVHWMGKGDVGQHEWACRMYSFTTDEVPDRPNRISGYSFNATGSLGAGSFFEDKVYNGQWIHYVFIINKADAGGSFPHGYTRIYKNGAQRDTDDMFISGTEITPVNGTAPFRIGTRDLVSFFLGAVGKIALYDYELSQAQITAHYQAMTSVAFDPFVAESLISADSASVSTNVPKTLSDAGTGADVLAITAQTFPVTDSGAGADNLIVSAQQPMVESGAAADSISVATFIAQLLAESGAGSDKLITAATQTLADASTATDALLVAQSLALTLSDAGTGSDAVLVAASIALVDTGVGVDTISITAAALKTLSDSGIAVDSITATAQTVVIETGVATDSATIGAQTIFTESGVAADAITLVTADQKQLLDSAVGNDVIRTTAQLALVESALAADAITTAQAQSLTLVDSGAATDALVVNVAKTLSDSATAGEILQTSLTPILSDSGSATEIIRSITATTAFGESGAASELLAITVPILVKDVGAASDQLIVTSFAAVTLIDRGAATERTPTIAATIRLLQDSVANDVLILLIPQTKLRTTINGREPSSVFSGREAASSFVYREPATTTSARQSTRLINSRESVKSASGREA